MGSEKLNIVVSLRDAARAGLHSVKNGLTGITVAANTSQASLGGMYKKLLAIGAMFAGGRFFGSALQTFIAFDDKMRAAGAVTKATVEELENMTAIAKQMGKTTRFTASEAAGGLKLLGMAGFEAAEAIEALPGVLNLAAAGTVGLSEAADIATNILAAFGLEVENLAQVNDVLVQTATSSNTTVLELGEAFKDIGAIAKGVGGDFEDIFAAIGKLGDAAFKGTRAGTALKGTIQALLAPTKQEIDLMGELTGRLGGVALQVRDTKGRFIGFVEIIKQLEKAGIKGDEALKLFGLRAGPGMQALVNQGSKAIEELRDKIKDSAGVAETVAEQMEAGIGGASRRTTAAFEGLKIKILETFGEETTEAIEKINRLLNKFTNSLDDINKKKTIEILKWEFSSFFTLVRKTFDFMLSGFIIFEKGLVALTLAITGHFGAAKEALQDIERDMLAVLQRIGIAEKDESKLKLLLIDKQIKKTKILITSSESLVEQARKDLKSWKAKIVGTEIYQKQLNKHLKTLNDLGIKLKTLQDEKNVIHVEIETKESVKRIKEEAEKNKTKQEAKPIGTGGGDDDFNIQNVIPQASAESKLKASLVKIRAIIKKELLIINEGYEQGKISLKDYYDERAVLIEKAITAELAILNRKRYAESDPDKILSLDAAIIAKKLQLETALLQLKFDFAKKEKKILDKKLKDEENLNALKLKAEKAFQDQKNRVGLDSGYGLTVQFQKELSDLQTRQNEELAVIRDFNEQKLNLLREQKIAETEIKSAQDIGKQAVNDLEVLQLKEKAQLIADQQERIVTEQLNNMAVTAGNMATILGVAYDLTGRKSKELFIASKAMAIAQATISAYESANAVYASAAKIPVVGWILAPIAAAAAIAAGIANVAAIRSQSFAEGGLIPGNSPHSKADNIPINATANEFMQPVSAVKYYGKSAMELIRRKAIPKEVFSSFGMPSARHGGYNFAEGGVVKSSGNSQKSFDNKEREITIMNINDPRDIDQYVASSDGQNALLNFVSSQAEKIKRILI